MSTPTESSPTSNSGPQRRRETARWLIATGIVALVVVVAAAAILPRITASGPASPLKPCCAPQRAASQVLSLSMLGDTSGQPDLSSLDPVAVTENEFFNTEPQLVHLLFDGHVTTDDANNVELWGADRVSVSSDGLTYTFHVRENQSFSDGMPVKASDYAWSIDRALNPCISNPSLTLSPPHATGLAVIKDALAFATERCASDHNTVQGAIKTLLGDSLVADDSAGTLTIKLGQPAAYFLDILALPDASVVERGAMTGLGADGSWVANLTAGPTGEGGSGIFYLAARDQAGNLVLRPNPHWWGQAAGKRPNFTELDVHLYASPTLDYASFLASPYDYVDAAPRDSLIAPQSRPAYHLVPALDVDSVGFSWGMPPFDNAVARQALCLAIDRDAIARQLPQSTPTNAGAVPTVPSWHLVPQGMPGYDSSLTGIDGVTATGGDLAKALTHWRAYLATLHGHSAPPVVFTYGGTPTSRPAMVAKAVAAQWSDDFPGLKASAAPYPNTILQEGSLSFQAVDFRWLADYPDPRDFLSDLYSTNGAYNLWGSSVPAADALLAQADAMSDPADQVARLQRYNQAEQDLVQQAAACPLFQYQSAYLLRPTIYGMRQDGLGLFADDDWVTGYRAR